jgi:histidinol dehydrogenase
VIRRLSTTDEQFEQIFAQLLQRAEAKDAARIDAVVAQVLQDVKLHGDVALLSYARQWDGVNVSSVSQLEISAEARQVALRELNPELREALEAAARRIRMYHEKQVLQSWEFCDDQGVRLGQKITPLDRVGIYVPGGKAAYPSSVLMNALPAKVAGVHEIIMTVPALLGEVPPLVLAAAEIAGVDRVFTLGGAQAIASMAYGTATVPKVDKIVGPGNAYVASAKRQVFGTVGIDMVAGPSEILIIADGTAPADWMAMDLFTQAEHDEMAQSILLCPDAAYIGQVEHHLKTLLPSMSREKIISTSLCARGALIHVRDLDEACALANRIAPEHLELVVDKPRDYLEKIHHAGAIFLGQYTPETLGDYCAGPNHVLPTSGTARFSSPLGTYDFQKRTSIIEASVQGSHFLSTIAIPLAEGEGLSAHAQAVRIRHR